MPFFLPLGVLSGFSSAIPYVGPLVEGSHHPCSRSGNALLGWYLAGLNFQVEHHLFPQCATCTIRRSPGLSRRPAVHYQCEPSLQLAANWRWLRRMGSAPRAKCQRDPAPLES